MESIAPPTPSATAAANVRAEMARLRVSQAELGAAIGMSQASVSLRLTGSVAFTINELVLVAGVLDVPLERLTEGVAA